MRTVVKSTITPEQLHKLARLTEVVTHHFDPSFNPYVDDLGEDQYGNVLRGKADDKIVWGVGIAGNGGHCVEFEVRPHNELWLWVEASRSVLIDNRNPAGALYMMLSEVVDPSNMTIVE
jgi:hypothetical protein